MGTLLGLCSICGKPQGKFSCHLCGKIVCINCYDIEHSVCITCRIGKKIATNYHKKFIFE